MKISLNGYYGFASYGDDLFNLACSLGARKWWSGHQVDIIGPPTAGVDGKFRVPRWFPPSMYTSLNLTGKLSRLVFFADALLRSDLILYAGGSTLTSGRTFRKRLEMFASERGIAKFAAIGVSIGPFSDSEDEAEVARFLRTFVHFSVRDQKSAQILERMGVKAEVQVNRDLAGVLPLLLPPKDSNHQSATPADRPTLGISLCYFERHFGGDTALEDRRNAALFEGAARFAKRSGYRVRIFCLNSNLISGDVQLTEELHQHLKQQGVEVDVVRASDDLVGCWYALAACQSVLSVRLHGAITAYLCGVPFALVEYHRKCTDFLEDVGQSSDLRICSDCADPAAVEKVLERLANGSPAPGLPCAAYTRDAARTFTQAPWATAAASS